METKTIFTWVPPAFSTPSEHMALSHLLLSTACGASQNHPVPLPLAPVTLTPPCRLSHTLHLPTCWYWGALT